MLLLSWKNQEGRSVDLFFFFKPRPESETVGIYSLKPDNVHFSCSINLQVINQDAQYSSSQNECNLASKHSECLLKWVRMLLKVIFVHICEIKYAIIGTIMIRQKKNYPSIFKFLGQSGKGKHDFLLGLITVKQLCSYLWRVPLLQ